jgi:hypothetical protein
VSQGKSTLTDQERRVLENFELLLRQNKTEDQAAGQLVGMGIDSRLVDRVLDARHDIAEGIRNRSMSEGNLSFDPELIGSAWYAGTSDLDIYWPTLENALTLDAGWAAAVPSLDTSSHDIVGMLHDPHQPLISTRGLVVGHVQSGKTANFTATIAKAADSGYRMFIVLGGVHNSLRRQTQLRLERQLLELQPTKWLSLTTEHNDFGNPLKALPLMSHPELRLLAVVKKNASRLRRLRDWLTTAAKEGGLATCPVLIIDDEADQASPNAAKNQELDRTAINKLLVEILRLPRVAYIGYTATPFANVLIDPKSPEDLYPRHFIYSLPKPSSYFGAEELFGLNGSEDEGTQPHDMVRIVPDEEASQYIVRPKEGFDPVITESLATAIRWFILATAARRVRSNKVKHSSMLIHTTSRVFAQFAYEPLVNKLLRAMRAKVEVGDLAALEALWSEEAAREPAEEHGLDPVAFDAITARLMEVLDETRVVVDNGSSPNRLLYDEEAATTVIAIGGNTLSRGLTLEGLVASYFLRGASAYDTLLQMGRWFGYRPGYADLPRIWTTHELISNFRHLALIERDIRSDIERYSREQTTPSDLAVRIRLHPKMQVTSRLRMQFAVPASLSFSGQRPQTIKFHHRDASILTENHDAARTLVSAAIDDGIMPERSADKVVLRNVAVGHVLDFISRYDFHEESEMSFPLLKSYIDKQVAHGLLTSWNLAVITKKDRTRGCIDLGFGEDVNCLERSRLAEYSSLSVADIGTLMSKPDRVADLLTTSEVRGKTDQELLGERTRSGRALILLYPIAGDSQPRGANANTKRVREPLDAKGHLIGLAIAFPTAPSATDPASTVAVDLSRIPRLEPEVVEDEDDTYVDEEGSQDAVSLEATDG